MRSCKRLDDVNRYSDYDDFAQVYNLHWGGFSIQLLPILKQLALNDSPAGATVLDLCCGTGQLVNALTDRGYRVVGVDGSPQMLKYARINAPAADFRLFDVRSFKIPEEFDIALSTYDSLNHLLTLDDLTAAFRSANRHLATHGVFVFDMNLEAGFQSRWVGNFNIWSDDLAVITESAYDDVEKLATISITTFTLDRGYEALWRRNDLTLTQRAYTIDELTGALKTAGFTDVAVFDARRDFNMRDVGRAIFRAKKLQTS